MCVVVAVAVAATADVAVAVAVADAADDTVDVVVAGDALVADVVRCSFSRVVYWLVCCLWFGVCCVLCCVCVCWVVRMCVCFRVSL